MASLPPLLPKLQRRHQLLQSATRNPPLLRSTNASPFAATKKPAATLFPSPPLPSLRLCSPSPAAHKFKAAAGDDGNVPIVQLGGDVRLMSDKAEGELVLKQEKDGVKSKLTMKRQQTQISIFHDLHLNTHVLVGVAFFSFLILCNNKDAVFGCAKEAWALTLALWARRPDIWPILTELWAKWAKMKEGK